MEELKLENEDQQEQLISMYNRVNDQEKEHNEALESHAAQTEDEVSDMKTQVTKDKKDLLKMLSTKFLAEKKALILEMQTKQEQAVIDAEFEAVMLNSGYDYDDESKAETKELFNKYANADGKMNVDEMRKLLAE